MNRRALFRLFGGAAAAPVVAALPAIPAPVAEEDARMKLELSHEDISAIRLDCVRIAAGAWGGGAAEDLASAARVLADFVLGTGDAEIIDAARTFAKKVG
jgi:hypothetical protein